MATLLHSSALDERWKTDLVEFASEFTETVQKYFPAQLGAYTRCVTGDAPRANDQVINPKP